MVNVKNPCFKFLIPLLRIVDEREDVQKKTFGKWINSMLARVRFYFSFGLKSSNALHNHTDTIQSAYFVVTNIGSVKNRNQL